MLSNLDIFFIKVKGIRYENVEGNTGTFIGDNIHHCVMVFWSNNLTNDASFHMYDCKWACHRILSGVKNLLNRWKAQILFINAVFPDMQHLHWMLRREHWTS